MMNNQNESKVEDYTEFYRHMASRPMKFFKDGNGCGWICDKNKNIDPHKDLGEQGCWKCDEMAFPTGGR
jgi:hypothetical protein